MSLAKVIGEAQDRAYRLHEELWQLMREHISLKRAGMTAAAEVKEREIEAKSNELAAAFEMISIMEQSLARS